MQIVFPLAACIVALLSSSVGLPDPIKISDSFRQGQLAEAHKASKADESSESRDTFLDERWQTPPRIEWNKDIIARSGGTFTFRVTSQGLFSVLVVTDELREAIFQDSELEDSLIREGLLLFVDSIDSLSYEGEVTVPAGRSWFIIENLSDQTVEFHLQCFKP